MGYKVVNSPQFVCSPDGTWSGNGACVLSSTACRMNVERGTCQGAARKWYYDYADGSCKWFWYSGCGGTPNRFESEFHCRQVCQETSPDFDSANPLLPITGDYVEEFQ